MALFLTNEEVERLVNVEDAIEVLEPTFADLGAVCVALTLLVLCAVSQMA